MISRGARLKGVQLSPSPAPLLFKPFIGSRYYCPAVLINADSGCCCSLFFLEPTLSIPATPLCFWYDIYIFSFFHTRIISLLYPRPFFSSLPCLASFLQRNNFSSYCSPRALHLTLPFILAISYLSYWF